MERTPRRKEDKKAPVRIASLLPAMASTAQALPFAAFGSVSFHGHAAEDVLAATQLQERKVESHVSTDWRWRNGGEAQVPVLRAEHVGSHRVWYTDGQR